MSYEHFIKDVVGTLKSLNEGKISEHYAIIFIKSKLKHYDLA
jgi:hypothetical protein